MPAIRRQCSAHPCLLQAECEECLLKYWDEDEDGPTDAPMGATGAELSYLVDHGCSEELLPNLEKLFDVVINESDEAMCSIDKMRKRVKSAEGGWAEA